MAGGILSGISIRPTHRWVMTQFFNPSWTKNPTLEEIRNGKDRNKDGVCDSTDLDVAREILRRANLADSFHYEALCEIIADALGDIENPRAFVNPNVDFLAKLDKVAKGEKESEVKEKEHAKEVPPKVPVSSPTKPGPETKDAK